MSFSDIYGAKVNISAVFVGTPIFIGLTRLSSLLPESIYFTFQNAILNPLSQYTWIALVGKLLIPVVVGILMGYIWREDAKVAAGFVGFMAPALMMWPFIIYWDEIAPPLISDYFYKLIFLYLLYIISSIYLCLSGSMLGQYLTTRVTFVTGDPIVISWSEIAKTAVKGLVAFSAEQIIHHFMT